MAMHRDTFIDPLYPLGTPFTDVITDQHDLREAAEKELDRRLIACEDRLMIVNVNLFAEKYPDLKEAYDKFKEEESKVLMYEALLNSK